MPDRTLYWFGNECASVTGGWIAPSSIYTASNAFQYYDVNRSSSGSTVRSALNNSLLCNVSAPSGIPCGVSFYGKNAISIDGATKLHAVFSNIDCSHVASGSGRLCCRLHENVPNGDFSNNSVYALCHTDESTNNVVSATIQSGHSSAYCNFQAWYFEGYSGHANGQLSALWLE